MVVAPLEVSDDDGSDTHQEEVEVSSEDEIIDDGSNIQKEEQDLSSDDSEPVIRRSRREVVRKPLKISEDETIDDTPSIQGDDPDPSSEDPDPIIIRRRRRPPAEILVSKSSTTLSAGDGIDITASDPGSPSREASVVSDLYDRIKNRTRNSKARTEQMRSRSPRPSRRISRQYCRRSPVRASRSRVVGAKRSTFAALSNRRGGVVEEARMTHEELRDEEDVLEVSPPADSETSQYEEDEGGDGENENESEE